MTYAKDRLNTFAREWEIDEVMKTEKKASIHQTKVKTHCQGHHQYS